MLLLLLLACSEQKITSTREPPAVTLLAPADGSSAVEGEKITFETLISDEDPLEALAMSWESDLQGTLGGEPTLFPSEGLVWFATDALQPGDHQVIVRVIDTDGEEGLATVGLSVSANHPPSLALLSPASGTYLEGESIAVEVSVQDSEQPASEIELRWTLDGGDLPAVPLTPDKDGRAAFTLEDLSPGTYTLSVSAADAQGATAADSASLEVRDGDADGDGATDEALGGDDCDDTDAEIHPGADEVCDEIDNNCDGLSDAADPSALGLYTGYQDRDGDGWGDPEAPLDSCEPLSGASEEAGDCEDNNPDIHPEAEEVCDGADNNCDALIDEEDPALSGAPTWHVDGDGDGWGDPSAYTRSCEAPPGYVAESGDCEDASGDIHPGASELCDGLDNDCEGTVDEGAADASLWYADGDGDGYGSTSAAACDAPPGYIAEPGDCEDADAEIHPGAEEVCDGLDNDCEGTVDEGAADASLWYVDGDGDGWGDEAEPVYACALPGGAAALAGDCAPADPEVNPGAAEVCGDGLDNNCDGGAEGCQLSGEVDIASAPQIALAESAGDAVGWALAPGGDLDGDGRADLLIGAEEAGDNAQGEVYLLIGGGSGEGSLGDLDGVIVGPARNSGFGAAVAAGDMDGDGGSDALVGAWLEDGADDEVGAAYLFPGPIDGAREAADASARVSDAAGESEDALGAAVAAGDLDGDGADDWLVSAPGGDPYGTREGAGIVYIFLAPGGEVDAADADYALYGDADGDALGSAAALSDVDGDGRADVLAGAPYESTGANEGGAAYVFLATSLSGAHSASGAELALYGVGSHGEAGSALAAGDTDGDGRAEIAAGAPGVDDPASSAGAVFLAAGGLSGAHNLEGEGLAAAFYGEEASEYAGSSLSMADADGDGLADLLIGAYGSPGDTNYVNGGRAGLFYAPLSGERALSDADWLVLGSENYARAGADVCFTGDMLGDASPDVALGAPHWPDVGSQAGAVFLFAGAGL